MTGFLFGGAKQRAEHRPINELPAEQMSVETAANDYRAASGIADILQFEGRCSERVAVPLPPPVTHGFWIHDAVRLRVKLGKDLMVRAA